MTRTAECTFNGRLSSMESNGPPGPKGVYASLLPSLTKCPRSNEIPPYGSGENFLVIGPILPSLPTVAKGFVSQDAGSTHCVPLSAFWSLSCSLSVHGQRELMTIDHQHHRFARVHDGGSNRNLLEQGNLAVGPLSAFTSSSTGPVVQRIASFSGARPSNSLGCLLGPTLRNSRRQELLLGGLPTTWRLASLESS